MNIITSEETWAEPSTWAPFKKEFLRRHIIESRIFNTPSEMRTWFDKLEFVDLEFNNRIFSNIYYHDGTLIFTLEAITDCLYKLFNSGNVIRTIGPIIVDTEFVYKDMHYGQHQRVSKEIAHISYRNLNMRCGMCDNAFEGICNFCYGENFGFSTEINDFGWCRNWKSKNID